MSSLSVVIPAFNNQIQLDRCLNSIFTGDEQPNEIIVVDDGSKTELTSNHNSVRVIRKKNGGPAIARNLGAEFATSEYIFFIDSDCWVCSDTIKKINNLIDDGAHGYAGPYLATSGEEFVSVYSDVDLHARYSNINNSVVYVHGTYNLILKKSVFSAMDGFDINYPRPSGEDFDLVLRIADKFGPLRYLDDVKVATDHETSKKKYLTKQFYRGFDRVYYYKKNVKLIKHYDYYTLKSDFYDIFSFPVLLVAVFQPLFLTYFVAGFAIFLFRSKGFGAYTINYLMWLRLYLFNVARFSVLFFGLFAGVLRRLV